VRWRTVPLASRGVPVTLRGAPLRRTCAAVDATASDGPPSSVRTPRGPLMRNSSGATIPRRWPADADAAPPVLAIGAEDEEGSAHLDGASPLDEEGSLFFDGASPSRALPRACVLALRTCEAGTTTCVRVATTYSAGTSPCVAGECLCAPGKSPCVRGTRACVDDSRTPLARARVEHRLGSRTFEHGRLILERVLSRSRARAPRCASFGTKRRQVLSAEGGT
jgi:hypothetical protein